MNGILGVALQSMQNDAARLDRVSMNMANALTPAYKRELVIEHKFTDMMQSMQSTETETAQVEVATDYRQGTFKVTGHSFDFAIDGDGYFELSTPNGPAYTRKGNFRLDAQGRLVSEKGFPVMGKGGEIIVRTPKPNVDLSGKFSEENDVNPLTVTPSGYSGQLKIVKFMGTNVLTNLGEGLVELKDGSSAGVENNDAQIHQGQLENSNVNSTQEMVQVMQTMRHFESMQKIAQGYDEMIGTAIRKLGEVN